MTMARTAKGLAIELPPEIEALPPGTAKRRLAALWSLSAALILRLETELAARKRARRRAARLRREGRALRCSLCGLPVSSHGALAACKGNGVLPEAWAVESEPRARWVGVPVDPPSRPLPVIAESARARTRPTRD